jgi:Polyketide cyclase / dehydrase and lipid transport
LPVLHVSVTSPLPPQQALQRLTDFSPARAEAWAGVDDDSLTVHGAGEGWAEVTEGNRFAWERERYTWDAAAGTVSVVTLNSNIWSQGSGWNYTIMPDGAGSRVEVTAVRKGYGIRGKLVGAVLSLIGKRRITSSTTAALAAR